MVVKVDDRQAELAQPALGLEAVVGRQVEAVIGRQAGVVRVSILQEELLGPGFRIDSTADPSGQGIGAAAIEIPGGGKVLVF